MEVSLIFPHQIYEFNPCINTNRKAYIIEEHLYFTQFKFHKQKLVLHRATMKFYEEYLKKYGFDVEYIAFSDYTGLEELFAKFAEAGVKKLHHVETVDYLLEQRISKFSKKFGIIRKLYETPNFILKHNELSHCFESGKYNLSEFYIKQRKKTGILVKDNKPVGGKWNFNTESRKKIPSETNFPKTAFPEKHKHTYEAIDYVEKNFAANYGNTYNFCYPVTFVEAIDFLDDFLKNRLGKFGDYQDAIITDEVFMFHSVLTPAMNTGILSPEYIINRTLDFHNDYDYPLNSLEGFIRQILGWREFIRAAYVLEGKKIRTANQWKFKKQIPQSFWNATTGIKPLDDTIGKVLSHGWCHHSERLMILGNFMMLCEFHPTEVYNWFMEMFIDAYDWVMVPNVYGMSQNADGGLISSKPYITPSAYIIKMSDYKKEGWCEIWDSLYWRFVHRNRKTLAANPRMKLTVHQLDTLDKVKLTNYLAGAEKYLTGL